MEEGPARRRGCISWDDVSDDSVEVTSGRSDIISLARFARSFHGVSAALRRDEKLPFDLPCLLHAEGNNLPHHLDKDYTMAAVMGLDKQTIPAYMPYIMTSYWAGACGEWQLTIDDGCMWELKNLYTGTAIPVPSLRQSGFAAHGPFKYSREEAECTLMKVLIASPPRKIGTNWWYHLIAVFDAFIVVLHLGPDRKWRLLKNHQLAPATYVDVAYYRSQYYAVTANTGDVFVWNTAMYGKVVLPLFPETRSRNNTVMCM